MADLSVHDQGGEQRKASLADVVNHCRNPLRFRGLQLVSDGGLLSAALTPSNPATNRYGSSDFLRLLAVIRIAKEKWEPAGIVGSKIVTVMPIVPEMPPAESISEVAIVPSEPLMSAKTTTAVEAVTTASEDFMMAAVASRHRFSR